MTATETRALRLNVLRDSALGMDCTRGGASSTHTVLHLVGYVQDNQPTIHPMRRGVPKVLRAGDAPVVIQVRYVFSTPTLALVPLEWDAEAQDWFYRPGTMMGGNYAASSDSRFSELAAELLGHPFYGALAIHDRRED